MNATTLLAESRRRGIDIRSNAGKLVIDAPRGAIDAEFRNSLSACKAEILCLLEGNDQGSERSAIDDMEANLVARNAIASVENIERYSVPEPFTPLVPGQLKIRYADGVASLSITVPCPFCGHFHDHRWAGPTDRSVVREDVTYDEDGIEVYHYRVELAAQGCWAECNPTRHYWAVVDPALADHHGAVLDEYYDNLDALQMRRDFEADAEQYAQSNRDASPGSEAYRKYVDDRLALDDDEGYDEVDEPEQQTKPPVPYAFDPSDPWSGWSPTLEPIHCKQATL